MKKFFKDYRIGLVSLVGIVFSLTYLVILLSSCSYYGPSHSYYPGGEGPFLDTNGQPIKVVK